MKILSQTHCAFPVATLTIKSSVSLFNVYRAVLPAIGFSATFVRFRSGFKPAAKFVSPTWSALVHLLLLEVTTNLIWIVTGQRLEMFIYGCWASHNTTISAPDNLLLKNLTNKWKRHGDPLNTSSFISWTEECFDGFEIISAGFRNQTT